MKKRIMMNGLMILAVLAGAYLFLRWFERANVWIPHRQLATTPAEIGLDYQEVWLEAEDGVRIHAWHLPHPEARAALLFCHGNAGNISYRLESLRQFHSLQLSVLIFDYRGYGRSQGLPSEEGTYRDAAAAYDWLRENSGPLPIILFGRSLGASIATELATRVDAEGLIFESGFVSVPAMGAELFPFLPVRLISTIQYDNLSKIDQVQMPILFIHSRHDEIVPYDQGRQVYEAANPPKRWAEISGGHNDGFLSAESRYIQAIDDFIANVTEAQESATHEEMISE
mgnify:CR=1 FL=1